MDSYLELVHKIQGNPSMMQYDSSLDDYLIVEGEIDRNFYENFVKNVNLKIAPVEAAKYDLSGFDSPKHNEKADYDYDFVLYDEEGSQKKQIVCLINSKLIKGKNFYGIIDADYDYKINQAKNTYLIKLIKDCGRTDASPKMNGNYINITDGHSLETMMIKYSYSFLPNQYKKIVDEALNFSYKIGIIRQWHSNHSNKTNIIRYNFKKAMEKSDYYYDCLNYNNIIDFSINGYFGKLKYEKFNILKKIYITQIHNNPYNLQTSWEICQGHDIIAFIYSIARLFYAKKIIKMYPSSYDSTYKDFESWFLRKCSMNFSNSPIGQWLANI